MNHGTTTGYRNGCRCDSCRTMMMRRCREYRRRKALGQTVWADRAPVVEHVDLLRQSGMSWGDIARVGGFRDGMTLREMVTHTSPKIRQDNAQRILAILPQRLDDSVALVPALGTRRRLQALARIGWDVRAIAARTGTSRNGLMKIRLGLHDMVTVRVYKAVREFYERGSGVRGPSAAAATYAARKKWHPPLAWDDDTIEVASTDSAWRNTRQRGWDVMSWT